MNKQSRLDVPLTCRSCHHFRARKPEDKSPSYVPEHAKHWCDKLNIHTWPGALRCGGDDYYNEKANS